MFIYLWMEVYIYIYIYIFSNWKQADERNLALSVTAYTWNASVNLDGELNTRVASYVHKYIVFFFFSEK